jgi:hypothetical protein
MPRLLNSFVVTLAFSTVGQIAFAQEAKPAAVAPVEPGAVVPLDRAKVEVKESEKDGKKSEETTAWYDARLVGIEGQAFSDTKALYDRLPARAEKTVRPAVWGLSRNSAGLCVRFVTDARQISCRWSVTSTNLGMPHMPATGVSGVDLYARDDAGTWRWLAAGKPTAQTTTAVLVSGLPEGKREYRLYFPLYNSVSDLQVGLPQDRSLARGPVFPEDRRKPIVFYGTSITHGASASRTGMVHTAILGRRFDRPVVNLGFSGNGKMEKEVVEFINEIDAAVFVIDCLPNMTAAEVTERTIPLVEQIRAKHPATPILLVEDRNYSDAIFLASKRERNRTSQAALKAEFAKLQERKIPGLFYLSAEKLLGDDNEGTVDSSHPTDLGFFRQADAFEPVLKTILGGK